MKDPRTRDEQIDVLRTLARAKHFNTDRFVALVMHILRDLLTEELARYHTLGLHHPHGSAVWLAEQADLITGIPGVGTALLFHAGCPLCESPGVITRCPQCSIGRCARCAATHDGGPTCQQIAEYAWVHAQMRDTPIPDPEPQDFYFARRSIALSLISRSRAR